eukprot:14055425-Ditylum_brightwellii.AAC.1
MDLPDPLLFCNIVLGLNVLPVSLNKVTLFSVLVTKPMVITKFLLAFALMTLARTVTSLEMKV